MGDNKTLSVPGAACANWHLTFRHSGSIEHFYHFLLGCFAPLVYKLSTCWAETQFTSLIVRSCGPLDTLIREIGDNRIKIVDKDEHLRMELSRIRSGTACHSLPVEGAATVRFLTVQGFDDPVQYDRYKFRRAKEALLNIDK